MPIPAEFTIATAEESRSIDAETVDSFGIDEFTLMEVAGISAAKKILKKTNAGSEGVFLCGKGNNGGDALVVARYLAQHDVPCTVVFVGGDDELSPTAQKNYGLLKKIDQSDKAADITFCKSWSNFDQTTAPGFIIDGMLGTGLDSELRGDYPEAVQWANSAGAPVYAMDIPTGLHTDTGEVMGQAIRATRTFAFGVLKQGFYLGKGHEHTGDITFCELPFPRYIKDNSKTFLIDPGWVEGEKRTPARHKYEAGLVYIIAGSEGMTGAAMMAAQSAWAEGVGAVIVVCPRGLLPVFENNLPQMVKKPVGKTDDSRFKEEHLDDVVQITEDKPGTVLIGPGLGRDESTARFVQQFLSECSLNCVIDADALWALSGQDDWQKPQNTSWILTPHPGELSRLSGREITDDAERLQEVKRMTRHQNINLLSKGFPVILGTPNGHTYWSGYDTRIFSRAGFGDVLAGKIAAYRAMQSNPVSSCCKALLRGYHKISQLQQQEPHHIPEPLDLI